MCQFFQNMVSNLDVGQCYFHQQIKIMKCNWLCSYAGICTTLGIRRGSERTDCNSSLHRRPPCGNRTDLQSRSTILKRYVTAPEAEWHFSEEPTFALGDLEKPKKGGKVEKKKRECDKMTAVRQHRRKVKYESDLHGYICPGMSTDIWPQKSMMSSNIGQTCSGKLYPVLECTVV